MADEREEFASKGGRQQGQQAAEQGHVRPLPQRLAPPASTAAHPCIWATNVLAYWAVPMKRLMKVKLAMPAGSAAANASVEYQERKTRSTKCWMLQLAVLRISGRASPKNSRYPPAAPHRRAMRPTLNSP